MKNIYKCPKFVKSVFNVSFDALCASSDTDVEDTTNRVNIPVEDDGEL